MGLNHSSLLSLERVTTSSNTPVSAREWLDAPEKEVLFARQVTVNCILQREEHHGAALRVTRVFVKMLGRSGGVWLVHS